MSYVRTPDPHFISDRKFYVRSGDSASRCFALVCPVCRGYAIRTYTEQAITLNGRCCHFRAVYIDGACPGNGTSEATAGIGIELGKEPTFQLAIPVNRALEIDPYAPRTNQRTELLAAIQGLEELASAFGFFTRHGKKEARNWVIVTDSQYVVHGMTEWLPQWKRKGRLNGHGKPSSNSDLFCRLDEQIKAHESRGIKVAFGWIPRALNTTADELAKRAAKNAHPLAGPKRPARIVAHLAGFSGLLMD
jgi:ribonuclease HI